MQVSYKDVHSEIISGSDRAISHVNNWSRKYSPIANDVFSFVHEKLFDVNTQDILDTLKRSDHPLGNISKKQRLLEVEDSNMPLLSIQDIFHKYLEERGIPTWQEFRAHLLEKDMQNVFLKPWWATLVSELDAYDNDHIKDAITWRVGCMYYSAMRELHFISRMRERHGIQLKYHIFADVRLRTDFWIDTNNISLFLSNSSYRSGKKTRKKTAKDILSDRNPKLYFHEVEFSNQYDRGNLYMINDKEIDKLADALVR